MATFKPRIDPTHESFKPNRDQIGSYYRRIDDIALGLEKMEVTQQPNAAVQFTMLYFGCEKLAKAMVGIHLTHPAPDAFHRHNRFELSKLTAACDALAPSFPKDDLFYLFADKGELPKLAAIDPSVGWSARELRNKLNHQLGPGNVRRILKRAPIMLPKLTAFLQCHQQVLAHLTANYAHIS